MSLGERSQSCKGYDLNDSGSMTSWEGQINRDSKTVVGAGVWVGRGTDRQSTEEF